MTPVVFEVARTPEELKLVQDFASKIDHSVSGKYPVMVVRSGDKIVGFVEVIQSPVLLTAWVKDAPKEVVEAIKELRAWQRVPTGECLALCAPESPLFELMGRLGFEDTGLKLFRG